MQEGILRCANSVRDTFMGDVSRYFRAVRFKVSKKLNFNKDLLDEMIANAGEEFRKYKDEQTGYKAELRKMFEDGHNFKSYVELLLEYSLIPHMPERWGYMDPDQKEFGNLLLTAVLKVLDHFSIIQSSFQRLTHLKVRTLALCLALHKGKLVKEKGNLDCLKRFLVEMDVTKRMRGVEDKTIGLWNEFLEMYKEGNKEVYAIWVPILGASQIEQRNSPDLRPSIMSSSQGSVNQPKGNFTFGDPNLPVRNSTGTEGTISLKGYRESIANSTADVLNDSIARAPPGLEKNAESRYISDIEELDGGNFQKQRGHFSLYPESEDNRLFTGDESEIHLDKEDESSLFLNEKYIGHDKVLGENFNESRDETDINKELMSLLKEHYLVH